MLAPTSKFTEVCLDGLRIRCQNVDEFDRIYHSIFLDREYHVGTLSKVERIVDVGAHIGLASLYFHRLFPHAHVVAIEPNPISANLLAWNLTSNGLTNADIINAAVSNQEGTGRLIVSREDKNPWTWGDSLVEMDWNDSSSTSHISTNLIRLSQIIDQTIDILKVDIEGMESLVLEEAFGRLRYVRHIIVEYHPSQKNHSNSLEHVIRMLRSSGHDIELINEHGRRWVLPNTKVDEKWATVHARRS